MRKKKRTNLPLLILCLLLAVALTVSLVFLRNAKKDVALLEEQLQELAYENDSLNNLNQALRIQLDSYFLGVPNGAYLEEDYCSLLVDDWSENKGKLHVDTFAQVFFAVPTDFSAKLELRHGDTVISSQNVTLNPTEADTVFEADLSTSFDVPDLSSGEELQLCLTVEPANGNVFSAYAAGWLLEDGNLVIITG